MHDSLFELLRDPRTGERLVLYPFEKRRVQSNGQETVVEGLLHAPLANNAYPITEGVPVMLDGLFTREFLEKHSDRISRDDRLARLDLRVGREPKWNFSAEWDYHFTHDVGRTWEWTTEERVRQFLLEVEMEREECSGKLILDAGCGNGQLAEEIVRMGAVVIALDYSTSVFGAERRRRSPNVHFVRGDLLALPFDIDTFDVVISDGVLHHAPETSEAFTRVARSVKPGGKYYVWLCKRPERFFRRYCFYPTIDLLRTSIARLPKVPQGLAVKAYARALMMVHRMRGSHGDLSWQERVVNAYDNLTPPVKHYHTPFDVSAWFFANGFSPAALTHWDNRYGFGMVATKTPQTTTPGAHFHTPKPSMRLE